MSIRASGHYKPNPYLERHIRENPVMASRLVGLSCRPDSKEASHYYRQLTHVPETRAYAWRKLGGTYSLRNTIKYTAQGLPPNEHLLAKSIHAYEQALLLDPKGPELTLSLLFAYEEKLTLAVYGRRLADVSSSTPVMGALDPPTFERYASMVAQMCELDENAALNACHWLFLRDLLAKLDSSSVARSSLSMKPAIQAYAVKADLNGRKTSSLLREILDHLEKVHAEE